MAAATADLATDIRVDSDLLEIPVKTAVKIYKGTLVAVDNTGYALPADDNANHIVMGVATEQVDNTSGASGALKVIVRRNCLAKFAMTTVAITDTGSYVYVTDDSTVDLAAVPTNDVVVGIIDLYIDSTHAWVQILPRKGLSGTITTGMLATGCVTTAKLADLNVTTGKIALLAIDSTLLASNAVTTAKITDANVTLAKMAAESVDATKLADKAAAATTGVAFVPYFVEMLCDSGAATFSYTCPRAVEVIGLYAVSLATNAGATVKVTDNDDNDITATIDISTDKAAAWAATIDDAHWAEIATQVIKFVNNAAADQCRAWALIAPKA